MVWLFPWPVFRTSSFTGRKICIQQDCWNTDLLGRNVGSYVFPIAQYCWSHGHCSVLRLTSSGDRSSLPRCGSPKSESPWQPQGTAKTVQWISWATLPGWGTSRPYTKHWKRYISLCFHAFLSTKAHELSENYANEETRRPSFLPGAQAHFPESAASGRFSSTQYLVLNSVQSDGCRCKHRGVVFDFQQLAATTETTQTGKIKGKNLYVLYQSCLTKYVARQFTRQIRYERWCTFTNKPKVKFIKILQFWVPKARRVLAELRRKLRQAFWVRIEGINELLVLFTNKQGVRFIKMLPFRAPRARRVRYSIS